MTLSTGHVCRHDKSCVAGFEKRYHGIVSAFMFATETQQTIGELSQASSEQDITCRTAWSP